MKPDSETPSPGRPLAAPTVASRPDKIERAHLKDPRDASHQMFRYPAPPELDGFLERFWIPVWSVPPGQEAPQKVLQFPVCLMVVTPEYSRFYGVVSGLSTTTLTGDGWAVGVMLAPAAGYLVARRAVAEYTDRLVDLTEVLGDAGTALTERVRAAMHGSPASPDAHRQAMAEYHATLGALLPVDEEGRLVNRLVELVESRPDILRVAQVCESWTSPSGRSSASSTAGSASRRSGSSSAGASRRRPSGSETAPSRRARWQRSSGTRTNPTSSATSPASRA